MQSFVFYIKVYKLRFLPQQLDSWMGGFLPQLDHRATIQSFFYLFCLHKKDVEGNNPQICLSGWALIEVLLLSSPQVWRVTGTCSSWWMAEIFWKSVRDHGKRHATTNSRRTARPCGMNLKRPWSPNRHVSPKKDVRRGVSVNPFFARALVSCNDLYCVLFVWMNVDEFLSQKLLQRFLPQIHF